MNADFPVLRPFRAWCNKVLPAVYDDSLSYYELLCKVLKYINEDREIINLHTEQIKELYALLGADDGSLLDEWVRKHFPEYIVEFSLERRGYSSLWTQYSTKAKTIEIYPEIAPWFSDGSFIEVSINPAINEMIFICRLYTQLAEDTDEESETYGQMISLNQRLLQLGFDNDNPHWIPLFDLPEHRSTNKMVGLSFPLEIRRASTDGHYYQTHAQTETRMYANGSFAIYTYPQNFWRSNNGDIETGWYTQIWGDCTRIYSVGYQYSRYNNRTAEMNRYLFTEKLISRVGYWMYRQTGYNDTREDTAYIDCSGLIWWGLWFGCNLPLSSYGGDAQEHAGEFVTAAKSGDPLDISVMKPGDIVSIGYVPYTATEGTAYAQTEFTFTEEFSRSTHMAIYLGENKFMHITDSWRGYGFTYAQGEQYDSDGIPPESLIYPGVKLLSHGYHRENDNGTYRATGPYIFEGMDVFRKDANEVDVDGTHISTKACYRTVVRYFSDTNSWMVD